MPQLVLYRVGFLAIALLNAAEVRVAGGAPIGNTIVVVAALVAFRLMAGPAPGLDLSTAEQTVLGLGGTLGVAAFVGIPAVALWRSGFHLRPRLAPRDPGVRRLLGLSGWAVLHTLVPPLPPRRGDRVGGRSRGRRGRLLRRLLRVPRRTASSLSPAHGRPARAGSRRRRRRRAGVRSGHAWAFDSLSVWVLPVTAALVALAHPVVQVVAFGQADQGDGVALMAAGISSLALGLLASPLVRLLAAAWYALEDSRTPALAPGGLGCGRRRVHGGGGARGRRRRQGLRAGPGPQRSVRPGVGGPPGRAAPATGAAAAAAITPGVAGPRRGHWRAGVADHGRLGPERSDGHRGRSGGGGRGRGGAIYWFAVTWLHLVPEGVPSAARHERLLGLCVVVGSVLLLAPCTAGASEREVDRVLVVSIPTVRWDDLDRGATPNLDRLLAESAIADLSTRAVVRETTAGDGYTTMGAGTRARGEPDVDG